MKYLNMLNEGFDDIKSTEQEISKFCFLSEYIFNYITYEDEISELLAKKTIEVCLAVENGTTFNYISTSDGNLWYLILVNMPFLSNKLDWGCSIRGAWWVYEDISIDSCGLFENGEQVLNLKLNRNEWSEFVKDLDEFAKDHKDS